MEYNLHPIFVHFPIAFLFLYSFVRILPLEKWFPNISWKPFRIVLLVAGLLGAFVSSVTGDIAEDLTRPDHDIVEMHEWFANASIFFYGILFATEIWPAIIRFIENMEINFLLKPFKFLEKIITHRIVILLLSIAGLFAMALTGMLGGIMVYGTTADPLAPILLRVLGI